MSEREEVEAEISMLLDKPVLTMWEIGQALRIVLREVLDMKEQISTTRVPTLGLYTIDEFKKAMRDLKTTLE